MKARVTVTLKNGILDPQGKAIEGALKSLGVDGIASVRQGKVFDIEVEGGDRVKAEAALKARFAPKSLDGVKHTADGINGDIHADPEYRAHLIGVMAKQAVAQATGKA